MSYEYTDTEQIVLPIPALPGYGFFLDIHGQTAMRGQLRLLAGSRQQPSMSFGGDERTGWYQPAPFELGAVIFAHLRFLLSRAGVTYYNENGFGALLAADNLTADRSFQFPDRSGTLALVEDEGVRISTVAIGKTIEVTDVATLLLAENLDRLGYSIVNQRGFDIYIGFSADVVAGDEEDLNGGQMLNRDGGQAGGGDGQLIYVGPIYAIAPVGQTAIVSVIEFLP